MVSGMTDQELIDRLNEVQEKLDSLILPADEDGRAQEFRPLADSGTLLLEGTQEQLALAAELEELAWELARRQEAALPPED